MPNKRDRYLNHRYEELPLRIVAAQNSHRENPPPRRAAAQFLPWIIDSTENRCHQNCRQESVPHQATGTSNQHKQPAQATSTNNADRNNLLHQPGSHHLSPTTILLSKSPRDPQVNPPIIHKELPPTINADSHNLPHQHGSHHLSPTTIPLSKIPRDPPAQYSCKE